LNPAFAGRVKKLRIEGLVFDEPAPVVDVASNQSPLAPRTMDECLVCLQPLLAEAQWCSGCGIVVHSACYAEWLQELKRHSRQIVCPHCKTPSVFKPIDSQDPYWSAMETKETPSGLGKRDLSEAESPQPLKKVKAEGKACFSLTEVVGDLFSARDSLAHCVSKDVNMGKGIAVHFKQRFGQVEALQRQDGSIGDTVYVRIPSLVATPRYAFYLITKARYYQKPTYKTLTAALRSLRAICTKLGVESVSMPRIGCGLDRLEVCSSGRWVRWWWIVDFLHLILVVAQGTTNHNGGISILKCTRDSLRTEKSLNTSIHTFVQ